MTDAEQRAELRARLHRSQPPLLAAVAADARALARLRGERHAFRSSFDTLTQVIRLAAVTDAFLAQICYRVRVACRVRGIPILPPLLHRASIVLGQIAIGDNVVIGPGVCLPHGQVVVDGITAVSAGSVVGPHVTLGLRDGNVLGPHLGQDVRVGSGAKVFGPVKIGAGAVIGANAVVTTDLSPGVTVSGVPARTTS